MSKKQKKLPAKTFSDMIAADIFWFLLDHEMILTELLAHWTCENALTVRNQLTTSRNPSAGSMRFVFICYLLKDLCSIKMELRADSALQYMFELPVSATYQT